MLKRPRSLLAGLTLSLALAWGGGIDRNARAQVTWLETVYVPTSRVVELPATRVYQPTNYVTTSYVSPTVYTTTSTFYGAISPATYLPTVAYVPTRFVRPLRPRRIIESPIVATSFRYYLPTTYYLTPTRYVTESPLVATSFTADPCAEAATPAITPSKIVEKSASSGGSDQAIRSTPRDQSEPEFTRDTRKPAVSPDSGARPDPRGSDKDAANRSAGSSGAARTPLPGPSEPTPPVRPEPTPVAPPLDDKDPAGGVTRRDSLKPSSDAAAGRAVLQGRVVSADTKEPEEGVSIVLEDRRARFVDRSVKTDALGRFAVSIPDGDWTVKVEALSGRLYPIGRGDYTASSGKVTDASGAVVASLNILR